MSEKPFEETPFDTGEGAASDDTGAPTAEVDESGPSGTQGGPGGTEHRTTPEELEEQAAELELDAELKHLQEELTVVNDRHLRLAAEFENYRKRAQGEMADAWARAQADLVRRLVDSLDDLQRVSDMNAAEVSAADVIDGVELIERKLLRGLEEAGAEVIEPTGEPFDPRTMEAVMRVQPESPDQEDTVADVFQKGYVLKGHLIRPARVTVRTSD